MSGAGSRRKGHQWERDLVHRFGEVFGHDVVRRGIQYRAGHDAPDVVVPGLWVEAKVGARTSPRAALAQALAASARADAKVWPVAVCKDDRASPTATLLLDDFLDLLREWHGLSKR